MICVLISQVHGCFFSNDQDFESLILKEIFNLNSIVVISLSFDIILNYYAQYPINKFKYPENM